MKFKIYATADGEPFGVAIYWRGMGRFDRSLYPSVFGPIKGWLVLYCLRLLTKGYKYRLVKSRK